VEPNSSSHREALRGVRAARGGPTLAGSAALALAALGGLNWGVVGVFEVDVVAWLFGAGSVAARVVYLTVGAAAAFCLLRLPRWSRAG
jgi:uncharacterized membrane protein YuzA (DUF378 family)